MPSNNAKNHMPLDISNINIVINPLEYTRFPNHDIIISFAYLTKAFLDTNLYNRNLPHESCVEIVYNNGVITSDDICRGIIEGSKSLRMVAIVEDQLQIESTYDNPICRMAYSIFEDDFSFSLDESIKVVIIKNYRRNFGKNEEILKRIIYSINVINYQSLLGKENFFELRNFSPCFFVVN